MTANDKPRTTPNPPPVAQYCDIKQAAAYFLELGLNVSHHTLRRWYWDESMKFPRPLSVGGKLVWDKARLKKWLETRPMARPRRKGDAGEAANAA